MKPPLISLVVLGYCHFQKTTQVCLESLTPWFDDPEVEILALDNGSSDDSGKQLQNWCGNHPKIQCLVGQTNLGYAGGMNWGASHSRGEWVFLVNSDTIFPAFAIDALKSVLRKAPEKVAMIGPVTNAAGNGQRLWAPGTEISNWMEIGAWLNQHPTGAMLPVYRCDFFCIAIRRQAWDQLGGLDTAFGLGYYEDFDFSLRLRQQGWDQVITEDVFVAHVGGASFQGGTAVKALHKQNKSLLIKKHPHARFEHVRLGNLQVLEHYVTVLKARGHLMPAELARVQYRVGALQGDQPRSFFKRVFWNWKIKPVQSSLAEICS